MLLVINWLSNLTKPNSHVCLKITSPFWQIKKSCLFLVHYHTAFFFVFSLSFSQVFAFDPVDNARYMRPLFYNRGIPVPSTDQEAPQYV
ncbi:hypothetical protein FBUS_08296 [Fasciolopsis buskii]|uniref:Uncharacterized protein n=1 Tax=Fasciolopsis buskii TaxID=27845 RepID=A0A8E0VFR8_9TREM|nr:hypothetical protein FBUS_08296 [Fasciolopsis buski]